MSLISGQDDLLTKSPFCQGHRHHTDRPQVFYRALLVLTPVAYDSTPSPRTSASSVDTLLGTRMQDPSLFRLKYLCCFPLLSFYFLHEYLRVTITMVFKF